MSGASVMKELIYAIIILNKRLLLSKIQTEFVDLHWGFQNRQGK